jgi:hypothetical protein
LRKFIVLVALVALCAVGATGAAAAPGPNGHNDYGLCKAYFAGSQNGQDHKQNKGPFPALKSKAGDQDGDGDTDNDDVRAYCQSVTPGGKSRSAQRTTASKTTTTSLTATRLGL